MARGGKAEEGGYGPASCWGRLLGASNTREVCLAWAARLASVERLGEPYRVVFSSSDNLLLSGSCGFTGDLLAEFSTRA